MKKPFIPIILLLMALSMVNGKPTALSSRPIISPEKNTDDSAVVRGAERVTMDAVAVDAGKPGCGGNRSTYLLNSKKHK